MSPTTRSPPGWVALVGAVLLVAGGCGGRQAGAPREVAADSAPPPVATGPATADGAGEASDVAIEPADARPPCSTDAILLAVSASPYPSVVPGSLEAFHPATGELTNLGPLDCRPMPAVNLPVNGLAVDRSGDLIASNVNGIFRVQATDAGFTCQARDLLDLPGAQPIGIAFVGEPGAGERLFGSFLIVGPGIAASTPIGIVDLDAGPASVAGDGGSPRIEGALTGTGDGRLFLSLGATIAQLDLNTGAHLQSLLLPLGSFAYSSSSPFAF